MILSIYLRERQSTSWEGAEGEERKSQVDSMLN